MQPGLPPHPRELREKCFQLFAAGMPYGDIAFETRIPAGTVRAWSAREAWKQRLAIHKDQPQLDTETAIALARQAAEPDIPQDLPSQQTRYSENMAHAAVVFSEAVREMPAHDLIARADKIHKQDATARKALRIDTPAPLCLVQIALLSTPADHSSRPVRLLSPAALANADALDSGNPSA
jgi:hypothetical protein